ncbi:DUF2274 domain-containing protein [soil metagenome]
MPDLKLGKLPDQRPVKLSVQITPALHQTLVAYAALYAEAYKHEARVEELIPAMLAGFLNSDREFAKSQRDGNNPRGPN